MGTGYNDPWSGKGGFVFIPETVDACRALSMWMTWKCAVVDASGGRVICDPRNLSMGERERLCRGFIRQMAKILAVSDVPAPDVMTNKQHMLWMMDEYETLPAAIIWYDYGKPLVWAVPGMTEATRYRLFIPSGSGKNLE